ncbi:MAG: ABC transporter ATP-binding protein [Rhodanobacter sp.]|jgi:lipopolysaccharide transport system ATP-binding protein
MMGGKAIDQATGGTSAIVSVRSVGKVFRIYGQPSERLILPVKNRLRRFVGLPPRTPRLFHALRDISFDIAAGETVGIIGRNGSGKSTLLQIIVGTLQASAGSVSVNGRVSALLELGAGFNPEFTGRENVHLAGAILGMDISEMDELMPLIEKFADIGEFIDQPVKTYSSGMYVRLAFSTAIHVSPDILVVDEALAVGDTAFQTKCLTRIRKMQAEGVSIILVTHSTNTLLEYCDRGIYLRRGRVVLDGACREVVKRYADDLVDEEGGSVVALEEGELEPAVVTAREQASPASSKEAEGKEDAASEIVSVEIRDLAGRQRTTFSPDERLVLLAKVRVHRFVKSPCYGVQIKSVDDIALWAGTTENMQLDIPSTPPGIYVLRWELGLGFAGNRYVIAVGIGDSDSGEYHRHSRIPYAGHVDVLPQPHSGHGWLAPQPQFACLLEGPAT